MSVVASSTASSLSTSKTFPRPGTSLARPDETGPSAAVPSEGAPPTSAASLAASRVAFSICTSWPNMRPSGMTYSLASVTLPEMTVRTSLRRRASAGSPENAPGAVLACVTAAAPSSSAASPVRSYAMAM